MSIIPLWIILSLVAYLFFAIAAIFDKFILTKRIENPLSYAILVSFLAALSFIIILFAPSDFILLAPIDFFWAFVFGAAFTLGVLFFYKAIQPGEPSRVVPVLVSLQPIIVLLLAVFLIGEKLSQSTVVAFFIILVGAFLISYEKKEGQGRRIIYWYASLAALFFAINLAGLKFLFIEYNFIAPFVWVRVGSIIAAILFLFNKEARLGVKKLFRPNQSSGNKKYGMTLVVFGQIFGGSGVLLLNYAVNIGQVSLVNALQGVQHMYVFILSTFLSFKFPQIMKEKVTRPVLIQKLVAIVILIIGVAVLSLSS